MTRRDRRAQANNNNKTNTTIHSASDIPYSHPDPAAPKPAKTLFEIAEERRAQLQPTSQPFSYNNPSSQNVINIKINRDGTIQRLPSPSSTTTSTTTDDPPIPPIYDTLLFSISLSFIHFTLSTLTMHQYAQSLEFTPILKSTLFTAFPILTFLAHLFHGHIPPFRLQNIPESESGNAPPVSHAVLTGLRQLFLLVIANISGCYLIHLCNDRGYYAVMKNAPSVGTVWVFCVLELGLLGAVLGVIGPAGWARWKGYTIF